MEFEATREMDLEIIDLFPVHPSMSNLFEDIVIKKDTGLAIAQARESLTAPTIHIDGSAGNGLAENGAIWHRSN